MPSLQLRRGLSTNRTNITPATGELIFTTDTQRLYVGDGTTAGGIVVGGQTSGTVTSVEVSGGTTGLTTSGGPVTASGTITLAGTLAIANGGTGSTTVSDAINALVPTQITNSGKFLTTDGSVVSWGSVDAFPSQTNNSGKVLTTNGTTTSWSSLGVTQVINVSKGGNDTTGDGSITRPFLTIGAALSYINTNFPQGSNSGEQIMIMLAPGNYVEDITITRFLTNIWGYEGKSKATRISGTVTINGAVDHSGVFQNSVTLNNLFIAGGSNNSAVVLSGTIATTLEVNNCSLYTAGTGSPLLVNNTAASGNKLRVPYCEIVAAGNAPAVDITNVNNGVISNINSNSASTGDAWKFTNTTCTLGVIQLTTATSTNVLTLAGTSTINVGYSAFNSTKANGNGVSVSSTSTFVATGCAFNVSLGSGYTVYGPAGSVYVRGGNYSVFGTNSTTGPTLTALNMPTSVSASDITGTLAVANGGTGTTTSTGTGSTVRSASPTFTGTANFADISTSGSATVGTNLTVTGNLTVNGTTTTINSTTLVVDDKNIVLGDVATPTDITADGGGITLKGATDKTFNWVDSTDAWTSSEHLDLASGKAFYINGTSVLNATTLGSGVTGSSLTSVGTIGTGIWQGTVVDATYGGTAQSSWTTGDLLYASGSNTLNKLAIGSSNQVLTVSGGVPTWAAAASNADANSLTGTTLASNVVSSSLTSVGTLSSLTLSGGLTFGTNYTETRTNVTASASTTLDCSLSNVFNITMNASITTLTLSNVPASGRVYSMTLFVNQDAAGSKTIAWPGSVKWSGGTAPTLTTTGSKTDILTLVTHDGGTNWYGFTAGLNF
jgi:hypothetical protein